MNEKVITDNKCEKCQYTWTSRVPNPKACPRCKARLDTPKTPQKPTTEQIINEKIAELEKKIKITIKPKT